LFWAYYISCLEFFGGTCLILGSLTRTVAALFAGFMVVAAVHVHFPIDWFWTNRGIFIRGGGTVAPAGS